MAGHWWKSTRLLLLCMLWPLSSLATTPIGDSAPTSTLTNTPTASPIIGGSLADSAAQPWMVGIVPRLSTTPTNLTTFLQCGGTLIEQNLVLTAAHCVFSLDINDIQIVVGRSDLASTTSGEVVNVADIVVHPYYRSAGRGYDIAVIKLAKAVAARPLAMATAADDAALVGTLSAVYGWGQILNTKESTCTLTVPTTASNRDKYECETLVYSSTISRTSELRQASTTVFSNDECFSKAKIITAALGFDAARIYSATGDLIPNTLCSWDTQKLSSPCFGDSGGPLVATTNGRSVLAGIVSIGLSDSGCSISNGIEFYSRVSAYAKFVEDAKTRDRSLVFEQLCPPIGKPRVSYGSVAGTSRTTTLSWDKSAQASGYRVYFSPIGSATPVFGKSEFDANTTSFSANLPTGSRYIVAVQARSVRCDSAISSSLEVSVP